LYKSARKPSNLFGGQPYEGKGHHTHQASFKETFRNSVEFSETRIEEPDHLTLFGELRKRRVVSGFES
jgi:hypothetical protein